MLFPPVHACYKNLQHRSKHNPIIWAWRERVKLKFLFEIHWLNVIEPLIALFSFSLCMCNMFCFLWPRWMKFLRYAYIYIYLYIYHISYRWDLAATSLAYIWYLDATSVKKSHSHSPPLSKKTGQKWSERCACSRFIFTGRCWRRYRWYKIELFPCRKHSGEGGTFSV